MSKRRHYSENFNSEDYPHDVLTYLAKEWITPKTEMQDKFRQPGDPANFLPFSHINGYHDEMQSMIANNPNQPNMRYETRPIFNPLMMSEYMEQYRNTNKLPDMFCYETELSMCGAGSDRDSNSNRTSSAALSYWTSMKEGGDGSQARYSDFKKCCCITKPNNDIL